MKFTHGLIDQQIKWISVITKSRVTSETFEWLILMCVKIFDYERSRIRFPLVCVWCVYEFKKKEGLVLVTNSSCFYLVKDY